MHFSQSKIAAIFSFSLTSNKVFASLNSLQNLYDAMSSNSTLPGSSRSFPGIQLQMVNLQEYGCWCYFDELHGLGKGPVQNGYDKACKAMHQGITCASLDFPECDANTQEYDAKIRPDPEIPGNVVVDCEAFNGGDECAIATCYIESNFITLLMQESLEKENTPQYDLFSQSQGFDRKACHGSKGPREHDNICCGQYFANTRRAVPVYQGDGDKQCCEDKVDGSFKTYDATVNSCCDDGKVRTLGSC